MSDLWTTAGAESEDEVSTRALLQARHGLDEYWPTLAASESPEDFDVRRALMAEAVDRVVDSVSEVNGVDRISLYAALDETLRTEFNQVLATREPYTCNSCGHQGMSKSRYVVSEDNPDGCENCGSSDLRSGHDKAPGWLKRKSTTAAVPDPRVALDDPGVAWRAGYSDAQANNGYASPAEQAIFAISDPYRAGWLAYTQSRGMGDNAFTTAAMENGHTVTMEMPVEEVDPRDLKVGDQIFLPAMGTARMNGNFLMPYVEGTVGTVTGVEGTSVTWTDGKNTRTESIPDSYTHPILRVTGARKTADIDPIGHSQMPGAYNPEADANEQRVFDPLVLDKQELPAATDEGGSPGVAKQDSVENNMTTFANIFRTADADPTLYWAQADNDRQRGYIDGLAGHDAEPNASVSYTEGYDEGTTDAYYHGDDADQWERVGNLFTAAVWCEHCYGATNGTEVCSTCGNVKTPYTPTPGEQFYRDHPDAKPGDYKGAAKTAGNDTYVTVDPGAGGGWTWTVGTGDGELKSGSADTEAAARAAGNRAADEIRSTAAGQAGTCDYCGTHVEAGGLRDHYKTCSMHPLKEASAADDLYPELSAERRAEIAHDFAEFASGRKGDSLAATVQAYQPASEDAAVRDYLLDARRASVTADRVDDEVARALDRYVRPADAAQSVWAAIQLAGDTLSDEDRAQMQAIHDRLVAMGALDPTLKQGPHDDPNTFHVETGAPKTTKPRKRPASQAPGAGGVSQGFASKTAGDHYQPDSPMYDADANTWQSHPLAKGWYLFDESEGYAQLVDTPPRDGEEAVLFIIDANRTFASTAGWVKAPDGRTWHYTRTDSGYPDAVKADISLMQSTAMTNKIAEIADAVMRTNPGMNRMAAVDLARKTVARFPQMATRKTALAQAYWEQKVDPGTYELLSDPDRIILGFARTDPEVGAKWGCTPGGSTGTGWSYTGTAANLGEAMVAAAAAAQVATSNASVASKKKAGIYETGFDIGDDVEIDTDYGTTVRGTIVSGAGFADDYTFTLRLSDGSVIQGVRPSQMELAN